MNNMLLHGIYALLFTMVPFAGLELSSRLTVVR
jgi:hypothetical protein